ncbi:hypothetical protein BJI60_18935, partial [Acinetobacter baumannii]
ATHVDSLFLTLRYCCIIGVWLERSAMISALFMRNKPLKKRKIYFWFINQFQVFKNECNSRKVQQLDEL